MITLYQFPPMDFLPNASPFCLKMETYLKMVNLPYKSKYIRNPNKAPKSKLPFIKDDGIVIADSSLIIDYLKAKHGDLLDQHLTALQSAEATALQRLIEEHLYFAMLYFRWVDPQGWQITNKIFFVQLPFYLKIFLPNQVQKYMKKMLYCQGIGRHNAAEIYQFAVNDLNALSILLGTKKYFLGEQPASIDATAYGFLANIFFAPFELPIKKYALSLTNLAEYCQRMKEKYYPA